MATSSKGNVELTFVEVGRKGKKKLLRAGYQYYFQSRNKTGTQIWRCANKAQRCNASVTLNAENDTILRESSHTCKPNFSKNKINLAMDTCKKRCRLEWKSIPEIYESCMGGLASDSDSSNNAEVPPFSSVKNSLYATRRDVFNISKCKFKTCGDVEIPKMLRKDFLLYEDEGIFIFGSPGCLNVIKQTDLFLADGTFKSVPKPFEQLFTIFVDIGSTFEVTAIIPLFFCLLPNKKESSYTNVFRILKELFNVNIRFFKSDWETAIINAVKSIYPQVRVKGCFYHFTKAIWRNGDKLGMLIDKSHKRIVRLTSNLALMPVKFIPEAWLYVLNEAADDIVTQNFISYFEKQWMAKICYDMWSCSSERHRTTNALEGWHFRLNKKVGLQNRLVKNQSILLY